MKHVTASSSSEALNSDTWHELSALQTAERQCRRIVHKYAIAAGGVAAIPVPGAGVMFNDHALEALSSKILAIFELSQHQLARSVNEKASRAKGIGKMAHTAIKSKRVKGAFLSLVSKYGVMNVARLAPGVGTAIVSLTSVAVVEYFGHRLIDDCLLVVRSRPACKN
jgi:uncharacterized protein (DUF697 family)